MDYSKLIVFSEHIGAETHMNSQKIMTACTSPVQSQTRQNPKGEEGGHMVTLAEEHFMATGKGIVSFL